ncbi:Disease resistance protein [Melia azedarach]|uniref:Disease resistance protein n=1 Tax=Melia azedarach TaxID=155640 RepID=A0ACC1YQL0_MELAZ|nr:Disease resistance protein [Melia azedarach]
MTVGEVFLGAFLQVLFDRLAPHKLSLFPCEAGIRSELKQWKKKLLMIQAVLDDAEEKQTNNEAVKMWLDDLRDLAYDVEDILDEYATQVVETELMSKQPTNRFADYFSVLSDLSPSSLISKVNIESKIEDISSRLEDLCNQRNDLGLKDIAGASSSSLWRRRPSTCVPIEPAIYGRDEDISKILEMVLRDEADGAKFRAIPIVGMAGVGKTTLARQVYNDDAVKDFSIRIWVCVYYDFDILRISKAILESVTFSCCNLRDLNPVQVKLREAVAGKKFLLVLDDVWKMNYGSWEVLKSPFIAAAPGSKIILTTRSMEVASTVAGPTKSYELKLLSDDDCWSVFVKHAFQRGDVGAFQNSELIRKKVVEKCRGLPLVASSLGGLLHSKHRYDEWEDILNGSIWNLSDDDCDIFPTLKLSYHDLPSHLKRCFVYCALFPKDYEFEEKELVLLWMAEGLIQPSKNKQLEDIGSQYFHDLLSRSIFQKSSNGRVSLHYLFNDLAQWVSRGIMCRLDELEVDMESRRFERTRHCSYTSGTFDGTTKFEALQGVAELRTFLPLSPEHLSFRCFITSMVLFHLLPKCKKLRVMSLAGYRISELPNSIRGFRHLRYLDFSNTNIRSLPESASSLFNLQVLMLRNCFQLKKLPSNMGTLINLQHLDITGANLIRKMPLGMKELKCLRTLSNFIVGKSSGSDLQDLKNLKFLGGRLCISRLHNVTAPNRYTREEILREKKNLEVLSLNWRSQFDDSRNEEAEKNVLDMLQPHKNLKELTVRCYGGTRFSSWIGDPALSTMVILNLESCMNCTSLPSLGLLSRLKNLSIRRMKRIKSIGYEFYGETCSKPFQYLETLHFEDLQEWENWEPVRENEDVEIFPCLQELVISSCPKLSGKLPDYLPSLEKLVIYFCEQLVVSSSSFPVLCNMDINGCKGVTWTNPNDCDSLKSMKLLNISMFENCLKQDFQKVESLEIGNCEELMFLWQKNEICLEKQPQGLRSFTFLRKLIIEKCNALTSLPREMNHTTCLETLRIEDCHSLTFIMKSQLPLSLKLLEIKNCQNLRLLLDDKYETSPSSSSSSSDIQKEFVVDNSGSLKFLHIDHCPSLTCLSSSNQLPATLAQLEIRHCSQLKILTSRSQLPAKLTCLKIEDCPELTTLSSRFQLPATLTHLEIDGCSKLKSIVTSGQLPEALELLQIKRCPKLESIAEKFHNNKSLKDILISKCENLKSIPGSLNTLSSLTDICIFDCASLASFPEEGLPSTSLNNALIHRCENLNVLPNRWHSLSSLRKLSISECPSIISFPEEGFPTSLTSLSIKDLNIYQPLREWGLHKLTSLLELKISGSDEVTFPGLEMMLPTSLTLLTIKSFHHLKYLSSKGFLSLTSLESLTISGCQNLIFFPGMPSSLLQLYIKNCPLLENQCQRDKGQDWSKISHIPCVKFDDKFVYDPQEEDLYSISGSL